MTGFPEPRGRTIPLPVAVGGILSCALVLGFVTVFALTSKRKAATSEAVTVTDKLLEMDRKIDVILMRLPRHSMGPKIDDRIIPKTQ